MIRVAVDANSLAWGWGGIPRYVHRLVSLLVSEPDLHFTLLANARKPFADIAGAREVVCRRRGGALWRNEFVSDWLRRERPDVFWAPEALAPWRLHAPLVMTVHDLGAILLPGSKPRAQRVAYMATVRRAARRATRTIAVSNATAVDLQRLWNVDASRIAVVGNGIDDVFSPGDRAAEAARVRKRWGIDGEFVLAVGSIEPRKGLDVLVSAAAEAAAHGDSWQLVLAGGIGYRGQETARAALAAGGRWLGVVTESELVSLYRAAGAVAVPSLYEGFGFTAVEAMACGTPAVVAANSGGLVETSRPAAVVVEERTGRAWASGLRQALSRRDELASVSLNHARRFRWQDAARATGEVLRQAAGA